MEILMWKVPVVGENSNYNNIGTVLVVGENTNYNKEIYRLLERTPTTTVASCRLLERTPTTTVFCCCWSSLQQLMRCLKLGSKVELNLRESFLRHFEYPGGFGEEDRLVVSIVGDVFFLSGDESF